MATLEEFELACQDCDGPGLYAIQDGHRLRVGMTSNLSRFVLRQRTPVRILSVARLEPGEATRAWRVNLKPALRATWPKACLRLREEASSLLQESIAALLQKSNAALNAFARQ